MDHGHGHGGHGEEAVSGDIFKKGLLGDLVHGWFALGKQALSVKPVPLDGEGWMD